MTGAATGPVMFAYDGSELAKTAIAEAAGQLNHEREALVVTRWQPFNVGFLPPRELRIDAAASDEVRPRPSRPPRREPRWPRRQASEPEAWR